MHGASAVLSEVQEGGQKGLLRISMGHATLPLGASMWRLFFSGNLLSMCRTQPVVGSGNV